MSPVIYAPYEEHPSSYLDRKLELYVTDNNNTSLMVATNAVILEFHSLIIVNVIPNKLNQTNKIKMNTLVYFSFYHFDVVCLSKLKILRLDAGP